MDFVTAIGFLASLISIIAWLFSAPKVIAYVVNQSDYDSDADYIRPLELEFPKQYRDGELRSVLVLGGKVCHYDLEASDEDFFLVKAVPSGDFHTFLQCESMYIKSDKSSSLTLFVRASKRRILPSCSVIILFTSLATAPAIKWVSIK